jgi:putative serine protease PepD
MNFTENGAQVATNGRGILPGGPAAKGGLRAGDVIIEIDGKEIYSPEELIVSIRAKSVGDRVTLSFLRDGVKKTVTLTLIAGKK